MKKQPKLALALGSGGAKGLAHIGVLQVFEEYKIKPEIITGSSSGAIVGGLYSAGISPYKLEEFAKDLRIIQFLDLSLPSKLGFLKGNKAEKIIEKHLKEMGLKDTFEDCPIKFGCVATDLLTASPFYMTSGDLSQAIHASFAIPIVFKPVEAYDRLLIDGGPLTRVPVKLARKLGADIVIGVDCLGPTKTITKDALPNIGEAYTRFLNISDYETSKLEINSADYLINIEQADISSANLKNTERCIQNGRQAAEQFLRTHPELIPESMRNIDSPAR